MRLCPRRTLCLIGLLALASAAFAAGPVSGQAVYQKRCAACHDQGGQRIPPRQAIEKMPASHILRALDFGVMMTIAYPMPRDERVAVASFLGKGKEPVLPPEAFCKDRRVALSDSSKFTWNGWSPRPDNARFQPGDVAGLNIDQVKRLQLKWAYAFDGDITAFAQPTVIDGHVFVGSAGGVIQALRAGSGCLEWTFQANGPSRSAIVAAPLGKNHALLFADLTGWYYAIEAETGRLLWKKRPEEHEATRLTGASLVHDGIVYVPAASWEETRSLNPDYQCCTFRGSITAFRARTGEVVWKTYMIPDTPKQTGKNSAGTPQFAPSGAGVWATPTLDLKRHILYVATGDSYSAPASPTSDSIVALDLATGRMLWSKQTLPGDAWNSACPVKGINCPGDAGPDYDFGSSAILTKTAQGRDILLAGQKSGVVFALDPERKGDIVWQQRVGKGGTNGGVQWGMASDGQNVYAAVSDALSIPGATVRTMDRKQGGGLTALRVGDGSKVWYAAPASCAPSAPQGCSPAQSAAVTAIPGVVFAGSLDGHLRGYSSEDGKILWDFNTVRDYHTVNGMDAKGGSIDGPGAVVVQGMVFVNSGYARFGGIAGNVLLAFAPGN